MEGRTDARWLRLMSAYLGVPLDELEPEDREALLAWLVQSGRCVAPQRWVDECGER